MSNTKLNSLGFPKAPQDTRVVVAMSGGLDSSVCAALLHKEGYEVIGVTIQLHNITTSEKLSCAGQDLHDARRIAEKLGFTHHVLNYESLFRTQVIEEFANSYLRGETPIPCIRCNQAIKFGALLNYARELDADCMATGHYIRRKIDEKGHACLIRAQDTVKDQSYFLFATSQEQLDYLRFPLGNWSKDKTRAYAQELGLLIADKPESQDICFVPDGDYASLVKSMHPEAEKPGTILHIDGRIVGEHKGIIHYTIGQRKGLGIGGGVSENNSPLYVIALKPETDEIIVGPKEALARDVLYINECNWLYETSAKETEVMVKLRSVMKPVPAGLLLSDENSDTAEIHLQTPQYGIAAGQAAVCYINDRMIGGGWIIGTSHHRHHNDSI
ncbi:MAG: tRNA 2-thiouridine(34) synthase MnmA [Alphaproteobacteria bacterium]|nr:tRNA 2-thiouridine(34) synthase MnmA [Alphaproteobacteria bacterium]